MRAIKTVGLTKKYKDITAVDGIDVEICEGELFSLLGVNGAGKSTLIKMLSCLVKATDGDAFIHNYSILREETLVKSVIGVSPQETAVAQNLTVKENLELICGLHGFSKDKIKVKISEMSEKLNLSSVISKKAGKLSGGYKRRLSIAMALVSEPKVLFLDEPTLGLDVIARRELWEVIRKLKGAVTIILTTHYMEEAEALSDRVGIMKDGRLLVVGTVDEIMNKSSAKSFEDAFICYCLSECEK